MIIIPSVPLSTTTNIELLEQIVADQRTILMDVFNTSDVTKIPQMWALCLSYFLNFCH